MVEESKGSDLPMAEPQVDSEELKTLKSRVEQLE
jgi:hypothetical protein